jgi:hypothetical protein
MTDFAGLWLTTLGSMELSQAADKVEGFYESGGVRCNISGRLEGGRLVFNYREPTVAGEGWFEQVRSGHFKGQWRPQGESRWSLWEGWRPFDGIWDSTFGPLRLLQGGDHVLGFYQ